MNRVPPELNEFPDTSKKKLTIPPEADRYKQVKHQLIKFNIVLFTSINL